MSTNKYQTREAWLEAAIALMATELFKPLGYETPKLRVSVGFHLRGGKKVLGVHWAPGASTDKVGQIFISPAHADPITILATLAHEQVHAIVGNVHGHGKVFKKAARAIGLEGKLTATFAGPELVTRLNAFATTLGELPHAQLDPTGNPTKKQGTRMLKAECPETGYTVRLTKTWLLNFGAPICPCCEKRMTFELPEPDDSEE